MPETIATLCRRDIPRLAPDTAVRAALEQMLSADVSAAPVLDAGGALLGVLSQKDCFRPALAAAYHQSWTGQVADHMTRGAVSLEGGTDLVTAAEAFLDQPFRVFPVTEAGQVIGLLDRADLLTAFLRHG